MSVVPDGGYMVETKHTWALVPIHTGVHIVLDVLIFIGIVLLALILLPLYLLGVVVLWGTKDNRMRKKEENNDA